MYVSKPRTGEAKKKEDKAKNHILFAIGNQDDKNGYKEAKMYQGQVQEKPSKEQEGKKIKTKHHHS